MEDDVERVFMLNISRGLICIILATLALGLAALARQTSPSTHGPRAADPLGVAMRKLGVHTILLVESQTVDEMPLWSPDSRFVAVDIEGNWYKLDTWAITAFGAAKWHGQGIGAVHDELRSNATVTQIKRWKGKSQNNPREVVSKAGIKVELPQHQEDLLTSFVISKGSQKQHCGRQSWRTATHRCSLQMRNTLPSFANSTECL